MTRKDVTQDASGANSAHRNLTLVTRRNDQSCSDHFAKRQSLLAPQIGFAHQSRRRRAPDVCALLLALYNDFLWRCWAGSPDSIWKGSAWVLDQQDMFG